MAEVQGYWLLDRSALLACGEAKEAVQRYYDRRDRALSGENNGGSGR